MALNSTMPLADWRGDLTFFAGAFSTRPADESCDIIWARTCALLAPSDGPAFPPSKEQGVFFVPCLLKDAPLIGKTLERARERGLPLTGKQRSSQHVEPARLLVADIDGMTDDQLADIQRELEAAGLSYLLYSTFSHGSADKPGNRVRLIVPVDAPLSGPEYTLAASGLNATLLGGLADRSGLKLHQQQGVWATSPDRKHLAFRHVHLDGVASAKALIEAAPVAAVHVLHALKPRTVGPVLRLDKSRVSSALDWLDPNSYSTWVNVAIWLKVAYGELAYPLWRDWGEGADKAAKTDNEGRYAPENVWASPTPYIPPEAGSGSLFLAAMNAAMDEITAASQTKEWGKRARAAALYIRLFHPKLYAQTFEVAS